MLSLASRCFTSSGASDRPTTSFPTYRLHKRHHKKTTCKPTYFLTYYTYTAFYWVASVAPLWHPLLVFLWILLWLTIIDSCCFLWIQKKKLCACELGKIIQNCDETEKPRITKSVRNVDEYNLFH